MLNSDSLTEDSSKATNIFIFLLLYFTSFHFTRVSSPDSSVQTLVIRVESMMSRLQDFKSNVFCFHPLFPSMSPPPPCSLPLQGVGQITSIGAILPLTQPKPRMIMAEDCLNEILPNFKLTCIKYYVMVWFGTVSVVKYFRSR